MACNCLLQLIYFYILEPGFWKLCIIWSLELMKIRLTIWKFFPKDRVLKIFTGKS